MTCLEFPSVFSVNSIPNSPANNRMYFTFTYNQHTCNIYGVFQKYRSEVSHQGFAREIGVNFSLIPVISTAQPSEM